MKRSTMTYCRAVLVASIVVNSALMAGAASPASSDHWKTVMEDANREALEGWYDRSLGEFSDAAQEARKGGDQSRLAQSLAKVACMHLEMNEVKQSKPAADEAFAIAKTMKAAGKEDVDVLYDMEDLASSFVAPKITKDKVIAYEMALKIRRTLFEHHMSLERNEKMLYAAYMEDHKYVEAEKLLQSVIDWRNNGKPDAQTSSHKHPAHDLDFELAEAYFGQGDYKKAEPLYRDCLAHYVRAGNPKNRVAIIDHLAKILRATHRDAEALRLEQRSKAIAKWRLLPESERMKDPRLGDPEAPTDLRDKYDH
ncbi:MAG TPA: tetratricopeptide repeat protein [Planktothrix sp.]|jgi:tetratricopeptide (TPR) repeat protein